MVDSSELKQLVKSAFDESIPYYISFEEKYRLYAFLAREMSIISDIKEGSMVCDVLGGTGASTRILSELVGDSGHVFSINFSDKLIDYVQRELAKAENVDFIVGDVTRLADYLPKKVDGVVFNSSIYLVESISDTIESAKNVLIDEGAVSLTYAVGIFDMDGNDLMHRIKLDIDPMISTKPLIQPNIIRRLLDDYFDYTNHYNISVVVNHDFMKEFFLIPTESILLFPELNYEERVKRINTIFKELEKITEKINFKWGLSVACSAK